nr:T-cell immunoreceptor with Ig and ITIM domains isoform X1 [Microcebus murinus]
MKDFVDPWGWGCLAGWHSQRKKKASGRRNYRLAFRNSLLLHLLFFCPEEPSGKALAEVTQINWEQQDQLLAICHADLGWHIPPAFRDRVAPGPGLGLSLRWLTTNDTGEYFCIYHTYPDGIYKGRIFLEVLRSSVAEHSAGIQMPLLGAVATVLVATCTAVVGVVVLARKKSLRIRSVESDLRRTPAEREQRSPRVPASPGSCVQAEAGPAGPCGEQRRDDYAEPHDYFNVLSYRSLGSFSFLSETG